jgi:hypothetical protein
MRRASVRGAVALLLLLLVACGDDSGAGHASALPPGAKKVDGGCGTTQLYSGASEGWTQQAAGPTGLVQATGHDGNAVAFLFGHPLRAGEPVNPANKILWVMKEPRGTSDLVITAHPLGTSAPTIHQREAPDSFPGEIYPSIVNVPEAGCWAFTLEWNGNKDTIELPYTTGS